MLDKIKNKVLSIVGARPAAPETADFALMDEARKQILLNTDVRKLLDSHVSLDFPKRVAISMGEAPCVLKCRMCPQFDENHRRLYPEPRYLGWDVFKRFCEEFPNDGNVQLEISAYCDPLQNSECEEMIRYFREGHPDVYIILATEGVTLDDKRCEKLMNSGVTHISFSLNAASRENYKWLTGRDMYDKAARNLSRLIDLRNSMDNGPTITTHIIGIKENEPDFESFTSYWRKLLPDGVAIRTFGNWGGIVDGNVTPLDDWSHIDWDNRYPCLNMFNAIKVMSNGDYFLCFLDPYSREEPLGNIMETGIGEAWRTVYGAYRGKHLNGDFDVRLCRSCMVWALFPDVFERRGGHFSLMP